MKDSKNRDILAKDIRPGMVYAKFDQRKRSTRGRAVNGMRVTVRPDVPTTRKSKNSDAQPDQGKLKARRLEWVSKYIQVLTNRGSIGNQTSQKISKPPGHLLHSVAEFFFSPKTVKGTFEPLRADWWFEHNEALQQKREWKARWINVRYQWAFLKAMGLSKVLSMIKDSVYFFSPK